MLGHWYISSLSAIFFSCQTYLGEESQYRYDELTVETHGLKQVSESLNIWVEYLSNAKPASVVLGFWLDVNIKT